MRSRTTHTHTRTRVAPYVMYTPRAGKWILLSRPCGSRDGECSGRKRNATIRPQDKMKKKVKSINDRVQGHVAKKKNHTYSL